MPTADPGFLGIPAWIWLGVVATLAISAFVLKIEQYAAVLLAGRSETRRDHRGLRFRHALGNVLGQKRRFDEPVVATAHLLIVWACLLHVLAFFWNLLRGVLFEVLLPVFPAGELPYAEDVATIRWLLAGAAVLGFVSLAVTAAARPRSRGRDLTLSIIAVLFAASLAGTVLRERGAPAGALIASWVQLIATAGFLAYLPFSKDRHVLFAPVTTLTSSLHPGRLAPLPAAEDGELTWRELIGGVACAECARCERACPVFASAQAGSPRDLMRGLAMRAGTRPDGDSVPHELVSPEQLWRCSTCGVCMEVCPSFNEHVPLVVDLRRRLVRDGRTPERLKTAIYDLMHFGNSFAAPPSQRGRWTEGLDFTIPDARVAAVQYLWFVGDHASWDPGAIATKAAARLLHRARIDFGILYDAEQNAGNDIRRTGAEDVFLALAESNRAALGRARFEQIITTDPHTYNVLKNEYEWNGRRPAVLHISELLDRVFRAGALPVRRELRGTVTYQDPCYLGRYNGVYEQPRRVLRELGLDLAEMPRNRGHAACCGAGGGRVWTSEFSPSLCSPAEARVREAAAIPAVRTIVTTCPKDYMMLLYGLRSTGIDKQIEVKDLAELVDEATRSSPAPSGHGSRRPVACV